jgi:hypothetical protein
MQHIIYSGLCSTLYTAGYTAHYIQQAMQHIIYSRLYSTLYTAGYKAHYIQQAIQQIIYSRLYSTLYTAGYTAHFTQLNKFSENNIFGSKTVCDTAVSPTCYTFNTLYSVP